MVAIEISETLNERLRKHIADFGDTHESTINRLCDICEAHQKIIFKSSDRSKPHRGKPATETRVNEGVIDFSPDDPPRFTHSRLAHVVIGDQEIPAASWNSLIIHFAIMARNRISVLDDLKHYIHTTYEIGEVQDRGYKYIPEVGISIRGIESSLAYVAIRHAARKFNLRMELIFRWLDKQSAQHPGRFGRIVVEPQDEAIRK